MGAMGNDVTGAGGRVDEGGGNDGGGRRMDEGGGNDGSRRRMDEGGGNDGDRGAGMIQGDLRCGGSVRTVKEGGVLWRGFS